MPESLVIYHAGMSSFNLKMMWIRGFSRTRRLWVAGITSASIGISGCLYKTLHIQKPTINIQCESIPKINPKSPLEIPPVTKFAIACRLSYLAMLFTPVLLLFPIWLLFNFKYFDNDSHSLWWVKLLRNTLKAAGPLHVKFGQWLSSRMDIFPISVCRELGQLQSHSKQHSTEYSIQVINESTGKDLKELFDEFEEVPIGVGAVAQVHRGTLKNGDKVIVKILHPKIRERLATDFAIMEGFASLLDSKFLGLQYLAITQEMNTFKKMMLAQTDLAEEGRNLDTFRSNFINNSAVKFPRFMPELSNDNMLVEEYIDGMLLSEYLDMGKSPCDETLSFLGLQSFVQMVFKDNFCHADMHPGNIMVVFEKGADQIKLAKLRQFQSSNWFRELSLLLDNGYSPTIYLLDVGLVNSLSPQNLENIRDIFDAGVNRNGNELARLIIERSRNPSSVINSKLFTQRISSLIEDIDLNSNGQLLLKQLFAANIVNSFTSLVRKHRIMMDGDFCGLLIASMIIEGIGRTINAELDIIPILVDQLH